MPVTDLHAHSHCSDGSLSPAELVARAARVGVGRLALTDHDTVAGLDEARTAAEAHGIELVHGVELSVAWNGVPVHLVGLGFDPAHPRLVAGLAQLAVLRAERAERIAQSLAGAGFADALVGARAEAHGPSLGRVHFARFLWRRLRLRQVGDVYRRYLVHGRPGHVHVDWPELGTAIAWLQAAGGRAVLAHPARYRMTRSKLARLLDAGREAGLAALEVVTARATPAELDWLAELARRHTLAASLGSDFHSHEQRWIELGRFAPLPPGLAHVLD
jgi:predicted metal-dependent phosphoesterase TrpH